MYSNGGECMTPKGEFKDLLFQARLLQSDLARQSGLSTRQIEYFTSVLGSNNPKKISIEFLERIAPAFRGIEGLENLDGIDLGRKIFYP